MLATGKDDIRLFITCGSGLESFAHKELLEKFKDDILVPDLPLQPKHGKIFFSCSFTDTSTTTAVLQKLISNLKSVERIFGIIYSIPHSNILPAHTSNSHVLLNYLFKLCSEQDVKKWLEFWKNELGNIITKPNGVEIEQDSSPPYKKQCLESTCRFRVNVKMTGVFRRLCNPKQISKSVGSAIVKTLPNWRIDLRIPDIEISLYLTDEGILFAVPLTSKPLSERKYLLHIPLRSTVAYSMASLIFHHSSPPSKLPILIMDPMCGTATILVEIAVSFPSDCHQLIGIDIDENQLKLAQNNIQQAHCEHKVLLLQGDATKRNPLNSQVDAIISDIPFGQQHGVNEVEVKKNLPRIIDCMNQSLKSDGVSVILISQSLSKDLSKIALDCKWILLENFDLKLGELSACIFAFRK